MHNKDIMKIFKILFTNFIDHSYKRINYFFIIYVRFNIIIAHILIRQSREKQ